MSKNDVKNLDWKAPSREWDIRVNLGTDWETELEHFISVCKKYIETVNVRFLLVGDVELGENQEHGSFQAYHCHVCLITVDRVTPLAVRNKLSLGKLSTGEPRNYYLQMRQFCLPYSGWIAHHTKCKTKVVCRCTAEQIGMESLSDMDSMSRNAHTAFSYGNPPRDKRSHTKVDAEGGILLPISKAEYKKQKTDERFQEMLEIFSSGDYDHLEMLKRYGKAWQSNFKAFSSMLGASECPDPPLGKFPDGKTLVIWGPPGAGKSLYVKYRFPKAFFRSPLEMKFWGGFKPTEHTHIYYEDLDRAQFSKFGAGQWKVWLDPNGGYDGEIKFERPLKNIRHPVIVTSNYHPSEWVLPGWGHEIDKEAILRRLNIVHINDLLKKEGIRLIPNLPPNTPIEECWESHTYSTAIATSYVPGFNPQ